ncbi:MAG: primosomal protein N' [Chloroflexi bacterium]|nr:primosomal protein N' [Chloroflexota bacterium]
MTLRTAEVAVFSGAGGPARTFTYGIPDGMDVAVGQLVRIPLAARTVAGVAIALDVEEPAGQLRNVAAVGEADPVLRPYQIELARWIAGHYRCALADAVRAMVPPGLARRTRTGSKARLVARRIPGELTVVDDDPVRDLDATAGQGEALAAIGASLAGVGSVFLLHGITGSGKTEVYMRAVALSLERGRGAIVLVPEIGLTPQVVARFVARFGERVALLHSALSEGERADEWRRVLAGTADVVVGSRSALFAPLARPGLIVVDEEQEPAYKQESDPRYHAVDAAIELGRITGATVVLGSATPRVTTYHAAREGAIRLLDLPERPGDLPLPPTTIVDLRLELKAGNRTTLSRALRVALERTIEKGEQAILYLNRRGYATVVLCRDCGHVLPCPACEIPYAFHADGRLVCHRCGRSEARVADHCPKCGSVRIRQLGVGTQRVEDDVRSAVPKARVLRLDRDAVRKKGAHAAAFELMRSGRAQVIVGTQMVAKGFDLPGVTLVGVINADTVLNLPDHTAAERTFELLTQVLGRSGRGAGGGRGILQTYLPEHYAIRAAAAHDYAAFAEAELATRRQFGLPPFGKLVLLQTSAKQESTVERRAAELSRALRAAAGQDADVLGPAPAFAAKKAGSHRAQTVLRGPRPAALLDRVPVGPQWSIDVDPVTLLG